MKYTIPLAVTFEVASSAQAMALANELVKLVGDSGVKFALQGAAVRSGATKLETLIGRPAPLSG